ncbi:DUF3006 domain-containing protein [Deinococcus oregonensis]|uniref:DUF3006 domain-containing protein n=1 Tax=Deinococcus oregonensis TaxID=1805970 RepID=A0ABV6B5U2_9DEIO
MPDHDPADLLTVDALEGQVARVELQDGTTVDLHLTSLPKGVREGDVLQLTIKGGDLEIRLDTAATRDRHQQAQAELDTLNQPVKGDVNL